MAKQLIRAVPIAVAFCVLPLSLLAQDKEPSTQPATQQMREMHEQMYGSQLMTAEERLQYREKMRSLKTKEEREAFRSEHHEQMKQRAKERGVELPDMPMPQGHGMMQGQGMGPGMGAGQGKGR